MKAGVTFGIEKQFRGGYRTGWDPARAAGDEFYSETFFTERPLALTPPRLIADTSAAAEIATSFRATLRLGGSLCQYAGPFVRARLAAGVQATLLPNPAWTLGHDARLDAGLTIDLLGINLLQQSAPIVSFPGAESLSGSNLSAKYSRGPAPAPGGDQRWAINVQDLTSPGGKIWVVDSDTTADGGLVAVTSAGQPGGQERVIRLSPSGEPLWDIQYAGIQTRVSEVHVRPDSNILVAGDLTSGEGVWLALHDSDGAEIWNKQYEPTNDVGDHCTVEEMIGFTDAGGVGGIVLAGNSGSTTNQTKRPCVLRLDEDGNLLWLQVAGELTFADSGDSADWELYDVIYTRDDGFLLVGYFNYLPFGDFQSTLPWAMKLDALGNVVWESQLAIPSQNARIGIFKAVTQSATGEFYLTGSVGGTVNETGGMLVAQLSEDGSDGKGAILYYTRFNQGSTEDANDDPNHWTVSDDVAATGNDTGRDIVAVDGGAVLVGTFGTEDEAWIIRLNEHLGVEWFNSYDGKFQDSFNSIDVTDTGLIVAGVSQSIVPNSALQGLAGKATLMVMNVPFEGLVNDFYPTLDMYRRYVLPTVFQGPDYYANSPMIQAVPSAEPLPLVPGTVTDLGTNGSLLMANPTLLCASVLTASSGVSSPLYLCDEDGDGLDDVIDNCPDVGNSDQADLDGDGDGDACDPDIDGDGLDNESDNCSFAVNAGQQDADADSIGNACDADLDNSCLVNFVDLQALKTVFFSNDPVADFNSDGIVNFADLQIMKASFFAPPGPSGLANACE
ncbi:MAG: hypothetical protein HKN49_03955 [Gammaproteobacteria bacterium]|nr:hypothetical protein [Gammaproteobacteria bacterium]